MQNADEPLISLLQAHCDWTHLQLVAPDLVGSLSSAAQRFFAVLFAIGRTRFQIRCQPGFNRVVLLLVRMPTFYHAKFTPSRLLFEVQTKEDSVSEKRQSETIAFAFAN